MSKTRSGAPRRVAAGLLAGALTVFGLALAAPAGAVEGVVNDRVAGADRFGTAAAACTEAYEDGTDTVIIATARNFPDALAASGLAGDTDACILLVEVDSVPEATVAAIDELGATNAIIVGGTSAVSDAVVDFLEDEVGITTSRVAGDDRFETASAIANELSGICTVEGGLTAILASGRSSADALAAGPLAAAGDGTNPCPILLTEQNDLPQTTEDAIADLGITNIIVVGGTGVISEAVRDEAGTAAGDDDVTVLAGTDRNKTAVAIADFEVDELGWAPTTVCLANSRKVATAAGADFGPDALTGGPLCGLREAPMLLVVDKDNLGDDTEGFIDDHSDTIAEILILGGTAVISDIAETAAVDAAENVENDDDTPTASNVSQTVRPELLSVAVVSTTAVGANPGTTVRYLFDEALTGSFTAGAGAFKLYTFGGTPLAASSVAIDPTDNKAVLANFPTLTTTGAVAPYSVGTVVAGAVNQLAGGANATNPEGDAPLQGTTATTQAAGITIAPDLVSVGNFRPSGGANTLVDFTFDENSYTTGGGGFHLVTLSGTRTGGTSDITCTVVPAPAGVTSFGNGTTIQTVDCLNNAVTGPLTSSNVARGFVLTGTVSDAAAAGNLNVLQAAEVANGGNATNTPNLVSVTLRPTELIGSTAVDAILYTFDRPVLLSAGGATSSTGTGFRAYTSQGTEVTGSATAETAGGTTDASRSTSDDKSVLVYFADGTLNNVVGANVTDSAVFDASFAQGNEEDEVSATPSSATGTQGTTDAPDLLSVTLTEVKDAFGTTTAIAATYTFDEPVDQPADGSAGLFKLWAADGSGPFTCTGTLAAGTLVTPASATSTVTCASFTGQTSLAQLFASTLGTVATGAVNERGAGTLVNPEGGSPTTGGNGTPTV